MFAYGGLILLRRAAVRSQGLARLDEALAVILETDGSFSVVRADDQAGAGADALSGVRGDERRDAPAQSRERGGGIGAASSE